MKKKNHETCALNIKFCVDSHCMFFLNFMRITKYLLEMIHKFGVSTVPSLRFVRENNYTE